MTELQTISWIFLATAIASQMEPTDRKGISSIADGINHAVPTYNEMQTSFAWLSEKELIRITGNKYTLTPKGKIEYDKSSSKANNLLKIWEDLEEQLNKFA